MNCVCRRNSLSFRVAARSRRAGLDLAEVGLELQGVAAVVVVDARADLLDVVVADEIRDARAGRSGRRLPTCGTD